MAAPQYSRVQAHPASVKEPSFLESRAEDLLGETLNGDLAAPIEEQLECINRVTAALIVAAKRNLRSSQIQHIELTGRQRQVLTMLDAGESKENIAAEICRSEETVKWHLWRLKQAFGVRTEDGLVRKARAMGLM